MNDYCEIAFNFNINDFKAKIKELKKNHQNIVINISLNDVNNFLVINTINSLHIFGLKITNINSSLNKKEIITNLTNFLENINEDIKIITMPYFNDVKKNLTQKGTYQGFNKSILNYVRKEIKDNIKEDDYVIDATTGNGNDTLFFATLVTKGQVFGFDIQKEAILATQEKVKDFPNVSLYQDSHENILNLKLAKKVKIILFNLGYLPNGDKTITTKASSTLKAIQNGLQILDENGKILVVIYPGHAEGKKEKAEILNWLKNNNYPYQIKRNTFNPLAPFLVIITNS